MLFYGTYLHADRAKSHEAAKRIGGEMIGFVMSLSVFDIVFSKREYLLLNGVDHNLGEGRQKSVRTQLWRTGQDSQRLILEVVTVI